MKTGPCSESRKKKIAAAQRRSWKERRPERLLALHNPEAKTRRMASLRSPEGRKRMSLAQHKRYAGRKKELMALTEKDEVKQALAVLRQTARSERLPTSKALAEVHRRIAAREAKQASQPRPVTDRKPARLWSLSRDSSVTHTTEPAPLPQMGGWQKILCGRLA